MSNQAVKVLPGLTPEAIVASTKEIGNAPVQDVVVKHTVDYLNMSEADKAAKGKKGKNWQGFLILFAKTDKGARTALISAGGLLAIQEEQNIPIFENTEAGYKLINFKMGITEGNVTFEQATEED